MAIVTFATDTNLTTLQSGFSNHAIAQRNSARESAYTQIVTALSNGGYAVSTIVAAPTAWPFLTMLEIRLAALDLLGGGAASRLGNQGGDNLTHWQTQVQSWLDALAAGQMALVQSDGTIIDPPRGYVSDTSYGIMSDTDRNPGIDLDEPENWPDTEPLEVW